MKTLQTHLLFFEECVFVLSLNYFRNHFLKVLESVKLSESFVDWKESTLSSTWSFY